MFLFLRKYGVEMSRAESLVSSYTCADLAVPNWRRRIGGAELSHSGLITHAVIRLRRVLFKFSACAVLAFSYQFWAILPIQRQSTHMN